MVNPTGQCTKAAQSIALEVHPKETDTTSERAKAKERAALQKDLVGRCRNYFTKSRYTDAALPQDVREVLAAGSATSDVITAVYDRVKTFTTGGPGPGTPPAGDANTVGQQLSRAMKQLVENGAAPTGAFGNFTAGADPITLPSGVAAPDYNAADATGNVTHQTAANIAQVAQFLKGAQATANAAWVAEAERGAPAAGKSGSDAWLALQHLRAFAKNVTNLPPDIKAAVDALAPVIGAGTPLPPPPPPPPPPPSSSNDLPFLRVRLGGGLLVSSSGVNFTDDQASSSLGQRFIVPGDQQLAAGIGAAFHLGVDFRLMSNATASWLLSLDVDVLLDPNLDGLQIPNGIDQNVRNSVVNHSQGTFAPISYAIRPGTGVSFLRDNIGAKASVGLGWTDWYGTDGEIFTGAANVVGGRPPHANELLESSFLVMPTITVFGGGYFTKPGGFQVGMEGFINIAGMLYPTASESTNVGNRTITNDINRFMFEAGVFLILGGF